MKKAYLIRLSDGYRILFKFIRRSYEI